MNWKDSDLMRKSREMTCGWFEFDNLVREVKKVSWFSPETRALWDRFFNSALCDYRERKKEIEKERKERKEFEKAQKNRLKSNAEKTDSKLRIALKEGYHCIHCKDLGRLRGGIGSICKWCDLGHRILAAEKENIFGG